MICYESPIPNPYKMDTVVLIGKCEIPHGLTSSF